jgi:hypothetical protein
MELYLTHPYASPLFGDFTGLPPLLIQAGESEVLRDEITLLAHKATLAGVQVMHELYEDAVSRKSRRSYSPRVINVRPFLQIHVFQAFPFLEASQHAFSSCRAFVRHGFALAQPQDPHPLDDHTEAGLASEIDNERAHMVRGDGQDKAPSDVETPIDSEQDSSSLDDDDSGGIVTEAESEDSFVSVDDSFSIQAEMDGSRSTPVLRLQQDGDSDFESDDDDDGGLLSDSRGASSSSSSSYLRTLHAQSYHGLENAQRVPSRVKTPRSPSVRSFASTLNTRHLRMSAISTSPVPSPSIRSSSSHPDISSLCEQWESTGPANITLTYKPGGTSFSASSSKSKNHKRSPSFHHA